MQLFYARIPNMQSVPIYMNMKYMSMYTYFGNLPYNCLWKVVATQMTKMGHGRTTPQPDLSANSRKDGPLHNQMVPKSSFVWYMWSGVSGVVGILFGSGPFSFSCFLSLFEPSKMTPGCGVARPVEEWPVRLWNGPIALGPCPTHPR